MTRNSLTERYLARLTARPTEPTSVAMRAREGYSLWDRYLAALCNIQLPARTPPLAAEQTEPAQHVLRLAPDRRGWFVMPTPPLRGALAAADGEDTIVIRASTLQDGVNFQLLRTAGEQPTFLLEIVLPEPRLDLPCVIVVRFHRSDIPDEQIVLVPIAAPLVGPAASKVALSHFDASSPWITTPPTQPQDIELWDDPTVAASIAAAADPGTRRAWRELAERVDDANRRRIQGHLA